MKRSSQFTPARTVIDTRQSTSNNTKTMKQLIQFTPARPVLPGTRIRVPLLLICLALLQQAPAVVPSPDGGYPGFNTAEGQNALFNLTTGIGNTGVGWFSLWSNTDGSYNTALGAGTLLFNIGNQSASEGIQNTAVGTAALLSNTTGSVNSAFGIAALANNTGGGENTATGAFALQGNTSGFFNTASGHQALVGNSSGSFNTAVGFNALSSNDTGNNNTAVGGGALLSNSTGGGNTALGDVAGLNLTTGNNNVCIGSGVVGAAGESNTTRIRNIGSTPIVGGLTVVVDGTSENGDHRLGYASSSRRYKEEIKPMEEASESLFALRPVTFRAKNNTSDTPRVKHYGLIAEEVATVDPDLVVFNRDGRPETLRFDSINAMLLNEFLKEHRKVEKLEAAFAQQREDFQGKLAEQEKKIAALASGLQAVSAQFSASKPAARVASAISR